MIAVEDAWAQTEVAERASGVQAEVGWYLAPEYHVRGLGIEAVAAVLEIYFDGLGLRRVLANCFADDVATADGAPRHALQMHTVRESLHRSGVWFGEMSYALLADEWRAGQP